MIQKKTKIICTIGPKSEAKETLTQMVELGMNVCRLNFSHGDYAEHGARIQTIKEVREATGTNLAILLDTKGPEIRTHNMENDAIMLETGKDVIVSMTEVLGTTEKFSITYGELVHDVKAGDTILLDDGLIGLTVNKVDVEGGLIYTTIQNGGVLKNKKGVNVPGVSTKLPGITPKDEEDIRFGCKQDIDFVAASFVRTKENVLEVRRILKEEGCEHVQIIPKIECQEAIDNIDEIIAVSDGIMIARGDLGVEVPAEEVPIMQKDIIAKCNEAGKFVITATQMLDSMQKNPRPTRAEVSDVANAIYDGTDAIMLSGESAAGSYPIESVRTMATIDKNAQTLLKEYGRLDSSTFDRSTKTEVVASAVKDATNSMDIKLVVALTESGNTARLISKYRPEADILAVTFDEITQKSLMLNWGVIPVVTEKPSSTDDMFDVAEKVALESGLVESGDNIVIVAGVPVGTGGTNTMRIRTVK